jgi:hypothetical protein
MRHRRYAVRDLAALEAGRSRATRFRSSTERLRCVRNRRARRCVNGAIDVLEAMEGCSV